MTEIEKELERFIESGKATKKDNSGRYQTTYIDPLKIAKHFAQWQKEQMMKDAIDAQVLPTNIEETEFCLSYFDDVAWITRLVKEGKIKFGERVNIIIIKEKE